MAVEADDAKEVRATALGVAIEAFGAYKRGMVVVVVIVIAPPFAADVEGILKRRGNSNSGEEGGDGEELHFLQIWWVVSTNYSNSRV